MKREAVTSAQNPKIKELLSLYEKSKVRRESGLFVAEGRREVEHCIGGGYALRTLFVCPEILGEDGISRLAASAGDGCSVIEVPERLYEKIAYRGSTEGVIAEIHAKKSGFGDIPDKENPLIIVLESVEKPGNLGAVLRSADAAGADAVIICDPLTDIYNPNLIRASLGAVFTTCVIAASSEETIAWLKGRGIRILTAQLQDSVPYYDTDMTVGTAIVMGAESSGLSELWRQNADEHIRIPMLGRLDSLNVSVSAAILLYEAIRQRNSRQIEP